ncbi:hypothetical protein GGQ99_001279 [Aminobacter niigataensis]|uniref:Uncharacterized protein n=1 Tax=Aminobacter niigataensis TaxID=83265 RepID=A0ABR6KYK6_9HYPH|nr:hypothetical protein [Aminobacter niigataensis]MBB4649557.1 hypothetical protein [Aminobacter niigataensis]
MTRWFMGLKPGVGPVLKVMKNDGDDPLTTPSTDWHKYIFDSEWAHKLGYVFDVMEISFDLTKWPKPAADGATATYYEPSGSTSVNALLVVYALRNNGSITDGMQAQIIFPENLGFAYTPLIETRRFTIAENRFDGVSNSYSPVNVRSSGAYESGYVGGRLTGVTWFRDDARVSMSSVITLNRRNYSLFGYSINEFNNFATTLSPHALGGGGDRFRQLHSVFELPIDNVPLPSYAGTPVEGQKVLRIAPDAVKMAYPGHDVAEGDHDAFIFSSERVPAKVIGAGQITINSGASADIPTKMPVTFGTYVDFIVKRTSEAQFYHPPFLPSGTSRTNRIQLNYVPVIGENRITVNNIGDQNFNMRYVVYADDNSAPTTGGSKVFHKSNDGSVDYIQLKTPGSSDSAPGLNEIILDSRLPAIPIVAEGWLAAADFGTTDDAFLGAKKAVIAVDNPNGDFLPFPKMIARWSDGSNRSVFNRTHRIFGSVNNAFLYNNKPAGCSINCKIFDDALHVYQSSGQPWRIELEDATLGDPYTASPQNGPSLVGIRYYVLAIPLSL